MRFIGSVGGDFFSFSCLFLASEETQRKQKVSKFVFGDESTGFVYFLFIEIGGGIIVYCASVVGWL